MRTLTDANIPESCVFASVLYLQVNTSVCVCVLVRVSPAIIAGMSDPALRCQLAKKKSICFGFCFNVRWIFSPLAVNNEKLLECERDKRG